MRGLADSTRILADPVDSSVFYAISLSERKLYRSADKGESFSSESFVLEGMGAFQPGWRGDDRGGQDRIYATPGRKGDLWIAAWDGLFHLDASKPAAGGALNFHRLAGVEEIHGFGFGKAAPGHDDPALYLVGTIQGQYGIFRSIDAAKSWVRINDDQHQWGLVLHVIGDPKQYGRVYVGAHGRGVLYGDPAQ